MIRFSKIIAAILVLLAVVLAGYAWMLSRQPAPAPASKAAAPTSTPREATFPVVVASKALPAGQAIEAGSLRVVQLSINPAGAFTSAGDVAGRVPVFDLGVGAPLLEGQLVSGLALRLEAGERAVAVKADEVMGVGNAVRPGDFVDVFFTLKADGKDIDRSQSRLLLARKRVLAYGAASVDNLPTQGEGKPGQRPQAQPTARTAVLAVPVEEVNRLALGETTGSLWLALRHPEDTSTPDPELFANLPTALRPQTAKRGEPLKGLDLAQAGLSTRDLVAGGSAPQPRLANTATAAVRSPQPVRPASGHEVEIIRGDRRDTVRY